MDYGFGLITVGLFFLMNPLVNVIDVLPDAIGWLCILVGMGTLSHVNDGIRFARKRVWILFLLTLVKLPFSVFSLAGEKRFPIAAEPVLLLTLAFSFGLLEFWLARSALHTYLHELTEISYLYGDVGDGGIRVTAKNDKLMRLTTRFLFARALCSVLPELVYLRSTEYLDYVTYGVVIDIRDYRPYLVFLFSLIAFLWGLVWFIRLAKALGKMKHDTGLQDTLHLLTTERKAEAEIRRTLLRFRIAFAMLFAAGIFFCHLSFDNINILPDFAGVFLTLGAFALLGDRLPQNPQFRRSAVLTGLLCIPYYGFRLWHDTVNHTFWESDILTYFRKLPENYAEKLSDLLPQLIALVLAIGETVLLFFFFRRLLKRLRDIESLSDKDGVTVYDSMTADMSRSEKEKFAKRPKTVLRWFMFSVGMEVVASLPLFAFTVTPVSFVRLILNTVFLVFFYGYLACLYRNAETHFHYN